MLFCGPNINILVEFLTLKIIKIQLESMLSSSLWKKIPVGNKYSYLEFGVYKGNTINFFQLLLAKFMVLDSFEGLKDEWIGSTGLKDCLI